MTATTKSFPPEHDGTVETAADGRAALVFERRLRHSVDRVWAAITEPAHMTEWLAFRAEIEPREGGRLALWLGDSRAVEPIQVGTIRRWRPPTELSVDFDDGSTIRFALEADGDGCLLRFSDTRPEGMRAQNSVLAGWHLRMDQLPDHLEGRPTDWLALDETRDGNGHVAAIAEIYWHYRNRPLTT